MTPKGDIQGVIEKNTTDGDDATGTYFYGVVGGNAYLDSTVTEHNAYEDKDEIVDGGLKGTVSGVNGIVSSLGPGFKLDPSLIGMVADIDTVLDKTESASHTGVTTATNPAGLNLQSYGNDYVRYYGAIGGDLSVNTGLDGNLSVKYSIIDYDLLKKAEETNIVRDGGYNNVITSGAVIGGVGGSAAAALGNVKAEATYTKDKLTVEANVALNGKTSTTVKGAVATTATKDANLIGFMNGGLAVGIGGTATSTITDSTTLNIVGMDRDVLGGADEKPGEEDFLPELTTAINVMKGSKVNAIGVMGGGTAVTTLGGTATSTVGSEEGTGTSTINVTNANVLGMIGGGAAASVDATGLAEELIDPEKQVGNDDGTSGFGIDTDVQKTDAEGRPLFKDGDGNQYYKVDDTYYNMKGEVVSGDGLTADTGIGLVYGDAEKDALVQVHIEKGTANQGGIATSTTGDTYLNITGDSTVIAAIGGGMAAASHTYTYKGDGTYTDDPSAKTNDAWGSSKATATTGRSHITVNLPNSQLKTGDGWSQISSAVGGFINGIKTNTTQADSLAALDGKGGVFGIFGGGVAVGHGSASSTLSGTDNGAYAVANTAGSDIDLQQGYAAAVFGGGAAVTINNARAEANMLENQDVNITTGENMTTVGLFGGGVAISMEGATASLSGAENDGVTDGYVAKSTVDTVNIINNGDTDGIFGGGMAIGNSNRGIGDDAFSSVTESNIIVNDGTVSNLDMNAFMNALKNGNEDGWPQWSVLGFNASGAMVDLKGIMNETSIAAGGLGLGMTGKAEVTTANVTIAGEDTIIAKDILGGGIAVDNMNGTKGGAHVGTSIIDLNGGTVEGSVYAGGAVNGTTPTLVKGKTDKEDVVHGYDADGTSSTVDTAIVNLNGTSVAGEISGQGYKMTTKYSKEDNYNPYFDGNQVTYTKDTTGDDKADVYHSVTESTLNISGTNTISALNNTSGKYTSDSKIHDFTNVKVAGNSTTILDGETVKAGSAALIDGGKVTVADSAKLDISALDKNNNDAYHIAANTDAGSTFWKNTNLLYDRTEGYANGVIGANTSFYDVTYKELSKENASDATKEMVEITGAGPLAPSIQDAMAKGWKPENGITAGGKQFFSDWSQDRTGAAYGRAAMIGEDAAVTGNTVSIARDMADNVMQRLSFTDDYVQDAGWVNNDGGIWAKYIHRKYETEGMGSSFGGIHSSTDYDGAIVGVDFAKHGNFQSGVAFHYGSGDGDGLISRNDYDAWGFTLYGSLKDEEAGTNLMADVGYVTSDNDIDGTVNGKSLSADRDVDAWTIGLRGEKEYVFGQNQLVPYVGLRYMSVNPARYSVYYDGAKAFNADADNQNLWLLPIGVSFRNETVTDGGWRITPKLDLSYIWAFGDTDTDMTLDMGGVGSGLYYDVMDDNSWLASLGVEATKDVWSFGVGYGYQKGDDTKNKTWFVNASYAF